MQSVRKFAAGGGLVLGICNGFQILCESGLLPGALVRNAGLRYICKQVHVRTDTTESPFTQALTPGQVLKIPIGHMEGNYFCEPTTLAELERASRIAFRYCTPAGEVTSDANPNGSISGIAGVLSEGKNVLGMMPHPDRSSEDILGSSDGLLLFRSLAATMAS
jgi:phosphoribosylformylglycinamidine synthase subunit PurQ / glutaminase